MQIQRLKTATKALRELGPHQLGAFALYRLALKSGRLRRATPVLPWPPEGEPAAAFYPAFPLPDPDFLRLALYGASLQNLYRKADEILSGEVRLFGGAPVPLQLEVPGPLSHWTDYENGQAPLPLEGLPARDVKWLWEPARFGWALTLGQAFYLTGDDRYAEAFWTYGEIFLRANPPNLGPQWISAQEVALRLVAFSLAGQLCLDSKHSTPARLGKLSQAIAAHAARIPPSLAYARAQHNNHLLSESAGLFTASVFLPGHPQATRWRKLGWRWFSAGLADQIDTNGAYVQQSTNYHRLALQLALWMNALLETPAASGLAFSDHVTTRLAGATNWLLAHTDPLSGQTPNLGPNDGAYILPLSGLSFSDYRPVLQAAGTAFLGVPPLPPGGWDDLGLWLGQKPLPQAEPRPLVERDLQPAIQFPARDVLRHPERPSWIYLRAVRFTSRPGHADQLHADLWWKGHNLARDAGTYLYNAPPPWDNALQGSAFHNTVTINGRDQMTRAGRFLWLDWAQARILETSETHIRAEHNGYRSLGIVHRRTVQVTTDGWAVRDDLLPVNPAKAGGKLRFALHWLLPDWPYQWNTQKGVSLSLKAPSGEFLKLVIQVPETGAPGILYLQPRLVRGGERLAGPSLPHAAEGWWAPTYGYKEAVLALQVAVELPAPVTFLSEWIFPHPADAPAGNPLNSSTNFF